MQEVFEKIIEKLEAELKRTEKEVREGKAILIKEPYTPYKRSIEIVKRAVEEYNNSWIPCSERLPEVPEGIDDDECPEFNVMIKGCNKATTLRCASDGTWFDEFGYVYPVVEWQPLPEPYRPCTNTDCVYNSGNECPSSEGCAGYQPKGA